MKFQVNRHIKDVYYPPIVEIKRHVKGDKTITGLPYIDLCQAVPDYSPAEEVVTHLQGKLPEPETSLYTADEGLHNVREAVCRRYERKYSAKITPDNICLTMGASQAFWLAMVTLCEQGDEVIVQVPTYFDYDMALKMMGIKCVYAPFDETTGGLPDADVIRSLITNKTRAILVVSPSNPTGMVVPPAIINKLYEVASEFGVALVMDETYSDFIAGGRQPHMLFEYEGWGNHFVHIMSFGKSYAMTGYRSGLLAGSPQFMHEALKAHDTMAICQTTSTQLALGYALDHLDYWVEENRLRMEQRHDCFKSCFTESDNPFTLVTSGAFFAWIKHPFSNKSGKDIAIKLIEQAGIVCLPGEIFGPGMSPYLRVAFGNIKQEMIPEAVSRFGLLSNF